MFRYIECMAEDLMERLQEYRLDRRLTQEQLAEYLGVSLVTINRWLNRRHYPNQIQEHHIRKMLKVKRGNRR